MPRARGALLLASAALLIAFHAALVRRWAATDRTPPGWDTSVHIGTAMDYREAWKEGRWLDLLATKARPGHPRYPPLFHYTAAPLCSSPAPHISVAWLNLAYFLALVLSSAWIAFLLGGPWPALAALFVMGLSPHLLYEYREAFPDPALAAWVSLAYLAFLKSERCARRSWSMAFGLLSGLAFLTRWSAAIYLLPAFAAGLLEKGRRRNLIAAAAIAAAACAPWYLFNFLPMLPQIWVSANIGHEQGLPRVWSWAGWRFYWVILAQCYTWPGVILMLFGSALALRSGWRKERWSSPSIWVAAWFLFSLLLVSLVPNKHWRYFMPAATALAALGFCGLPPAALPLSAAIALLHARDIRRPNPSYWPLEDILREADSRRDPCRPASIALLANHRNMNANNLGWLARHAGLNGVFPGGVEAEIPEWSDFVLLKTGDDPGSFLADSTLRLTRQALNGEKPFSLFFREARRWPLPDGSEAVLYESNPSAPLLRSPVSIAKARVRSATLEGIRISPTGKEAFEVSVSTIVLDKLQVPVRNVRARAAGARLAFLDGKVRVLSLRRLSLDAAELRWDELSDGLSRRARLPVRVEPEGSGLRVSARLGFLTLRAGIEVSQGPGRLRLKSRALGFLSWESALRAKPPYQPYDLDVGPLLFEPRALRISSFPQP
jgi:hypothetical protein